MTTFTCPCGEVVRMDWESPRYGLCEKCERLWREMYKEKEPKPRQDKNETSCQ